MNDVSREQQLDRFEKAFEAADQAAGADRAAISEAAQLDVAEVVTLMGIAKEADAEVAEAQRLAILAQRSDNRDKAHRARKKEQAARKQAKADHKAATRSARKAYNAVRYSNPQSLGFLRVILIVQALHIFSVIILLASYIKGSYDLDAQNSLSLLNVLFDGITFWLILRRKKFTRPWVIGTSIFNIIVVASFNIAAGVFNPLIQLLMSSTDLFMLLYFIFSKRVKATLVEPFNKRTLKEDLDEEESYFRPKTWEFWRNMIIYFVVFSVVGHWMEAAVCLLIKYGIVPGTYDPTSQIWSDWLYPFPVYGIGFCACALLLYPLKNFLVRKIGKFVPALIISYIVNALVCTGIELAMGLATNADLQLWDYSNMFCNFMGQVCLQNALFFGFAATLMTWVVYPALEGLFRRLPNEALTSVLIVSVVGCAILYALYYIEIPLPGAQTPPDNSANVAQLEQLLSSSSSSEAASASSAFT